LPFWTVITPQTNTVFLVCYAGIFMQLDKTSSKILASLLDSLIVFPDIWTKVFGFGVPIAATKTFVLGDGIGGGFEEFMSSADLTDQCRGLKTESLSYIGIKRFHKLVRKSPTPVDRRPARLF
jgi:hypothetical protein